MPLSAYGNLPTFTAGQILSASGHMNVLNRYIGAMRDDTLGVEVPYIGRDRNAIRHLWDTFEWYVISTSAGSITYDDRTIASWGGAGTQTGTTSLASLGLTVNEIYWLNVYGTGIVYRLRETKTPGYPSLASFANSTIPTAEEWQELSDYASELGGILARPIPVPTQWDQRVDGAFGCSFVHRARYLRFLMQTDAPHSNSIGKRHAEVTLTMDLGQPTEKVIAIFRNGNSAARPSGDPSAGGTILYEFQNAQVYTWDFYIDLETYAPGLSYSDVYNIHFTLDDWGEGDPRFFLRELYETPCNLSGCEDTTPPGYTNPTAWEHGDYVYGSTSDPKVQVTKANLEAISNVTEPCNWAIPMRLGDWVNMYGFRHRRWLHWYAYGDEIELRFNWRGAEETSSISGTAGEWNVADLDSIDGLYPGTFYWVIGPYWAFEDIEP